MRERAERIGGQLRILSRPNGGTHVELTIAGKSAYRFTSETPRRDQASDRSAGIFRRQEGDLNE